MKATGGRCQNLPDEALLRLLSFLRSVADSVDPLPRREEEEGAEVLGETLYFFPGTFTCPRQSGSAEPVPPKNHEIVVLYSSSAGPVPVLTKKNLTDSVL